MQRKVIITADRIQFIDTLGGVVDQCKINLLDAALSALVNDWLSVAIDPTELSRRIWSPA